MKKVLAVLAVAGLASSAMAQTFDGRVAFVDHHTATTTPSIMNGGEFVYNVTPGQTDPVTLNFAVMVGVFDTVGFDNRGVFSYRGDLNAAGSGVALGNTPGARGPFNFSPGANGTLSPNSISDLDLVRNPLQTVPWLDGEAPEPISTQGNNAFYSIFRFTVTISDFTAREVEISTADGLLTALAGWTFLGGEVGDAANWTAGPFAEGAANGSFTLSIVPAPGAAALLGLGGLVAARRRRA